MKTLIIVVAFILSFPLSKPVRVLMNLNNKKWQSKAGALVAWFVTLVLIYIGLIYFGVVDIPKEDTTASSPKQSNSSVKDKAQANTLKNKVDQDKGTSSDESKILGNYSYTDEMGSGYSIALDKDGVGTEVSYRVNWKIKWRLNGNQLTVIGGGMTTVYTIKDNKLISKDGTVYTKK